MSQISILCATISNQPTDEPPCFPILSGYSVCMTRIIMGSQQLHGTCHTKFWNRTRNWLFMLMWSTPCNHKVEIQPGSLWLSASTPGVACHLTLPKTKQEILNTPPRRRCQDETNFRKDWGTVVTNINSILQGHNAATVTFCGASSMPRNINTPQKHRA